VDFHGIFFTRKKANYIFAIAKTVFRATIIVAGTNNTRSEPKTFLKASTT
jgi:hypothetical protein